MYKKEKDFGRLVTAALALVKSGGVLFASTNAARLDPEEFLKTVRTSVSTVRRAIQREYYAPQPPDFPVHRDEPAHLKAAWMSLD